MPRPVPQARTALTVVALTSALALLGCGQDAPGAGSATPASAATSPTASVTTPGAAAAVTAPTAPATSGAAAATAPAAASPLPAMTVTDVTSGGDVPLADLMPADRPLLVWMWAPS